jgi:hypothetical protein
MNLCFQDNSTNPKRRNYLIVITISLLSLLLSFALFAMFAFFALFAVKRINEDL